MKKYLLPTLCLAAVLLASCGGPCRKPASADVPTYLDPSAPIEERVEDALSRLTVEEKVAMIHAQSKFSSPGVKRLGIPELWCTDGPHGIRPEVYWDKWEQAGWTSDSCVAFPALTCLAATWNEDMAALYGKSIGEEARYREKDVLLGPGVNIYRSPLGGRNFEYMGEDPFLASRMVVPYVREVQKNGVATCVKHFCLNNEETYRHRTDVDVSDRALYEIYLPAFKAAVQEGGSWSIMGAYNLYRGQHLCHNKRILCDILKGEWGFDGAVISDWGGVHDTDEAIHNGMDIEFGTWTDGLAEGNTNAYDAYFLAKAYLEKIRSGEVGQEELDDKCRRVLRLIFRTAMNNDKPFGSFCSDEHYAAARRIGDEGIVLLKNEGSVLPLRLAEDGSTRILVVGENAIKMMTVGGGSSSLKAQKEILPYEAIAERAGSGAVVSYERGYVGDPTNDYNGVVAKQDLTEERPAEELSAAAVAAARDADYVIYIGGLNKRKHQDCEGKDRHHLNMSYGQDELISALAAVNDKVVVVLVSGNAVSMPWIDSVPSVVQAWYIGSVAGQPIADVLFGDVCPSGKLPFTFPKALEDSPAHYDGRTFPTEGVNRYEEGIYVGYRWFDTRGIEPLFAFGHGLSYTTFEYGQARVSKDVLRGSGECHSGSCRSCGDGSGSRPSGCCGGCSGSRDGRRGEKTDVLVVSVPVKNTGCVAGAEVVQLYIHDVEAGVDRPYKELKGFEKVMLQPGESATVKFEITPDFLAWFDEGAHRWIAEAGEFEALVGSASDDIRTSVKFTLK